MESYGLPKEALVAMGNMEFSPKSNSPHFELFNAAYTGKPNYFKWLALNHAKSEGTEVADSIRKVTDEDKKGSLHFAAAGGCVDVCKYLLEKLNLDVETKDGKGRSPLYVAAINGRLDMVRYLLESGADADAPDDNNNNHTPLLAAAMIGDAKIIALLLSKGVQIDAMTNLGSTALQTAAVFSHQDAVKVLLAHGANPDLVGSQPKLRPLTAAIYNKLWEAVELLIQAGADPNAVSLGHIPLAAAARAGRADVVTRLLEAGANPDRKTNTGLTALEMAALLRNYQSVEILFPVTSRIPTYPDWSIAGVLSDVCSDANKMRRKVHEKEKFHQAKSKGREAFQGEQYLTAAHWFEEAMESSRKDPILLSNLSACYARLGVAIDALDYATRCIDERPEWPKAYYRLGVALNMEKRYGDAANAFNKGLALDPRNKELKDAYMKAIEDRLNSIRVKDSTVAD